MSENNISEVIALHGFNVKFNITTESTAEEATRAIDTVCAALNVADGSAERLRLAMGRLLAHVQDSKLYQGEFESFEAFTEAIMERHRISRGTLRDSLMVARRLPKLTGEQAEKIPMTSLTLVARAAKAATPAKMKTILRQAETMSPANLRQKLDNSGLISRRVVASQDGKVTLKVSVSKKTANQWERLIGDRDPSEVFAEIVRLASVPVISRKKAA